MTDPAIIEHAMKIAARVVVLYGETYLPIFERLHREHINAIEKKDKTSLAMQLAKSYVGEVKIE